MKTHKNLLVILFLTFISSTAWSQETTLLDILPTTKEEFIASEKKVLATIHWLENTPLNQEQEKRKEQNALLIAWITNSPTVTIELNSSVLPFTKKNNSMLLFFMGGFTKYVLENNYSKDKTACTLAGIRSAMTVYKKGVDIKKDKEMEKLIATEEKGELETWVRSKLEKNRLATKLHLKYNCPVYTNLLQQNNCTLSNIAI